MINKDFDEECEICKRKTKDNKKKKMFNCEICNKLICQNCSKMDMKSLKYVCKVCYKESVDKEV